jgi:putative spermidine/putrescine transport system permease protein
MTDATAPDAFTGATPDNALRDADRAEGPLTAADGTPLKKSLARALRREKLRALMLIAPLLVFVLVTFIMPIADMLFRSVENEIVRDTLPRTVVALRDWQAEDGVPGDDVIAALVYDVAVAAERREHTQLGSRLNYERAGMSSLFRGFGRDAEDIGEIYTDQFVALDAAWEDPAAWVELVGAEEWRAAREELLAADGDAETLPLFESRDDLAGILPETVDAYGAFARTIQAEDGDDPAEEEPWHAVYLALYRDLAAGAPDLAAYEGPRAQMLRTAEDAVERFETVDLRAALEEADDDWLEVGNWSTLKMYAPPYTEGYFLNAVDMQKTPEGYQPRPEYERLYIMLFVRTFVMSLAITAACLVLGYPVAWLLANLPARTANLLMILVLLPFWTSLLVRTSAWKVLLQQQGVINDILVWSRIIDDAGRLVMINNQTGTIIAMTHILLPFMILPLYSVMKTIPPSYLRAAKSLGATDWTAFWRVYFPQSVPGIGAGSILVFILAIGYYITPELVGGTSGVFISNRIAFHISSSLNWGLAAALGSILLAAVLILYWAYDKMVGIDNVKLGG